MEDPPSSHTRGSKRRMDGSSSRDFAALDAVFDNDMMMELDEEPPRRYRRVEANRPSTRSSSAATSSAPSASSNRIKVDEEGAAAVYPLRRSSPRRRSNRSTARPTSTTANLKKPPPTAAAANLKKPPPGSDGNAKVGDSNDDDDEDDKIPPKCCICMDDVQADDLASINGCDHTFCFECIEKWSEQENSCPLCKVRFNRIDRVNKKKTTGHGKGSRSKNSKRVTNRTQRRTNAAAALDSMLSHLTASHPGSAVNWARLLLSEQLGLTSGTSGSSTRSTAARSGSTTTVTRQAVSVTRRSSSSSSQFTTARAVASAARGTAAAAGPSSNTTSSTSASRLHAAVGPSTSIMPDTTINPPVRARALPSVGASFSQIFASLGEDSDDDEEEDLDSLNRRGRIHVYQPPGSSTSIFVRGSRSNNVIVRQLAGSGTPGLSSAAPGRQFATNSGDANAGQRDNPLEIDDSSDDDDDEVEIVDVRPGPSATASARAWTAARSTMNP